MCVCVCVCMCAHIIIYYVVAVLDNSCWFRVKPATKQRSEGEKVATVLPNV